MKIAPLPDNESERIKLLNNLQVLDTEIEDTYDKITQLAAQICNTPIALISLIDENRQWFKSKYGLEAQQTPRDYAFCSHAILDNEIFIVENSLEDDRFADNPLVTDNPHVIFYAGVPLEIEPDLSVGTLCVIDNTPRKLNEEQKFTLQCLAQQVITLFKLRKNMVNLGNLVEKMNQTSQENLQQLMAEKQKQIVLAQKQNILLEAKENAEKATRTKANFLATMTHEIRTPMNAIIGITEILANTPLNLEQKGYLEILKNSGEVLLNIVNDVLDFSKIESNKMSLDKSPFRVEKCLEEALDIVSLKATEKGLKLVYLIEPQVPDTIIGDSNRVRQILINLLNNAVKFTEKGEINIFISSHIIDVNTQKYELLFSVEDTGIGIKPEDQKYLFYPFSQVDISITKKYGGTGLGLAISKELTEMMGGHIWVESHGKITGNPIEKWVNKSNLEFTDCQGAKFNFSIIAQADNSQDKTSYLSEYFVDKTILIAERNFLNRQFLKQLTQEWKMKAKITPSLKEAIILLKTGQKFDLAILDFYNPDLKLSNLEEILTTIPQLKNLPLIILTPDSKIIETIKNITENNSVTRFIYPIKKLQLSQTFKKFLQKQILLEKNESMNNNELNVSPESSSLRILVAEDNRTNQKIALLMLKSIGYQADIVNNGLEALALLKNNHYDVILMDLEMPEMDGITASKLIMEQHKSLNCPYIIAMTAKTLDIDKKQCLEAGIKDYLFKPVRKQDLQQILLKANAIIHK